jgi:hypothetical protein
MSLFHPRWYHDEWSLQKNTRRRVPPFHFLLLLYLRVGLPRVKVYEPLLHWKPLRRACTMSVIIIRLLVNTGRSYELRCSSARLAVVSGSLGVSEFLQSRRRASRRRAARTRAQVRSRRYSTKAYIAT